jgi:hypothetical protein
LYKSLHTGRILGTAANLAVAGLFAETGWVWNVTISTAEPKSLIESRSFLPEYVLFVNQELLVYCIFTKDIYLLPVMVNNKL